MSLADREAKAALDSGLIHLSPRPPDDSDRWSPTTLDLTLDAEIRPWEEIQAREEQVIITPGDGFDANDLIRRRTQPHDCTNGFVPEPGRFALGWTVERLRLPYTSRFAARVEGKSSLARIGLGIHVTAPTIHPAFGDKSRPGRSGQRGSPIRLEIWNIGPLRIELKKGMAICQILFEMVYGLPSQGHEGQFHIQGPESPPRRKPRRKAS
jgi:dCTP deaminase